MSVTSYLCLNFGTDALNCDRGEFHRKFCVYYKLTAVDRKTVLGIFFKLVLNSYDMGSLLIPSCCDGGNTVSF